MASGARVFSASKAAYIVLESRIEFKRVEGRGGNDAWRGSSFAKKSYRRVKVSFKKAPNFNSWKERPSKPDFFQLH